MSKPYYFIDGYNLLFSLADEIKSLDQLRKQMVLFLQKRFAALSLQGTLVFDGAHRRSEESGLSYASPLDIAYAPGGESADSWIIHQIEISKQRKHLFVVTNDKGLSAAANSLSAKTIPNKTFLALLSKKTKKAPKQEFKETQKNFDRLLKAFEERLNEMD